MPNMPRLEIEKVPPWNSSGFSLPFRGALGQVLDLVGDLRQALGRRLRMIGVIRPSAIATATDDVGVLVLEDRVVGPGGVGVGHLLQRHGGGLDDEVVDRQLVLVRTAVQLSPRLQQRVDLRSMVR